MDKSKAGADAIRAMRATLDRPRELTRELTREEAQRLFHMRRLLDRIDELAGVFNEYADGVRGFLPTVAADTSAGRRHIDALLNRDYRAFQARRRAA